ncbi:GAF domain-containing protein [Sulfitobacter aestuariivivens]|uniref:GAF domain-containing protein n=1 Tax=Sulfitobacter aestuariivivens TaxID=2766981 RepID=UPI0036DD7178
MVLDSGHAHSEAARTGKVVHEQDLRESDLYRHGDPTRRMLVDEAGLRTALAVPMMSNGKPIGVIVLHRIEVARAFSDNDISLVESFAAQAVIAIESARQFRALQNRLQREAATRQVLHSISQSREDEQPVFDLIVKLAKDLCGANFAGLALGRAGDTYQKLVASQDLPAEIVQLWDEGKYTMEPGNSLAGDAILSGEINRVEDMAAVRYYAEGDERYRLIVDDNSVRSNLFVPLLVEGKGIGCLMLGRSEVSPYTEDQVTLVETFAAQAVIAIENVSQFREVQERLERETASRDVLMAISQSRDDENPVFQTIVKNAARLCNATRCGLHIFDKDEGRVSFVAMWGEVSDEIKPGQFSYDVNDPSHTARSIREAARIHIPDLAQDALYLSGDPFQRKLVDEVGYKTLLSVPLVQGDNVYGVIAVWRTEAKAFSHDEITLVETFAAQAVIAIENVRQFREVQARTEEVEESLTYQTATTDVLDVISRSPNEVQPVLDVILEVASRICDPQTAYATLLDPHDGTYRVAATHRMSKQFRNRLNKIKFTEETGTCTGRTALLRRTVYIEDTEADPDFEMTDTARQGKFRSALGVPLLKDGKAVGVITLGHAQPGAFEPKQIALLETFASQAVIALGNAQLFDEVQARTAEVEEALEYQTATSEVLDVISRSPNELMPVLDAILTVAARICDPQYAYVAMLKPDDGCFHVATTINVDDEFLAHLQANPMKPGQATCTARTALQGQTVYIADASSDKNKQMRDIARLGEFQSVVGVPLVKDGITVGVISLAHGQTDAFSARQIKLVETFAAQAVIAISNARLFDEVQQRTAEVEEALVREQASAEILQVINEAVSDLQPVFDLIVHKSVELCGAHFCVMDRFDDAGYHFCAQYGCEPNLLDQLLESYPVTEPAGHVSTKIIESGTTVQIADAQDGEQYFSPELAKRVGFRRLLGVPIKVGGRVWGGISMAWPDTKPPEPAHIELVQNFANQASIAIENARLMSETEARTAEVEEALEQQKASADILSAISQSVEDAQPVFEAILKSCRTLFQGEELMAFLVEEDEMLHVEAYLGEGGDVVTGGFPAHVDHAPAGMAVRACKVVHFADVLNNADAPASLKRIAEAATNFSVAFVPMIWEAEAIGVISVARADRPFRDKELGILQGFADQAVIAIQNARLFRETNETLQRQTATAEVLEVISNSVEDTKPVFTKILDSCERLIPCSDLGIVTIEADGLAHLGEVRGVFGTQQGREFKPMPAERTMISPTLRTKKTVYYRDGLNDAQVDPVIRRMTEKNGNMATVIAPMIWKGEVAGIITLGRPHSKGKLASFSQQEIGLLETFADQAVIAIQNARLFDETQTALVRQTASADILRVVSESQADLDPVFDAILSRAANLCDAPMASLYIVNEERTHAVMEAYRGDALASWATGKTRWEMKKGVAVADAILDRVPVHIHDLKDTDTYRKGGPVRRAAVDEEGVRTFLAIPLIHKGVGIGDLVLFKREVQPFSPEDIGLLENFADQAVIAIQNARLFNETQTALVRQTATADILRVVSETQSDLGPVFDAILSRAADLCEAPMASLNIVNEDRTQADLVAHYGDELDVLVVGKTKWDMTPGLSIADSILDKAAVHIHDLKDTDNYRAGNEVRRNAVDNEGIRTFLAIPLIHKGAGIGNIALYKREVKPFTAEDIALLESFADQAVIAIQNARLFNNTQTALARQTASADVLRVISQSPTDTKPVFDEIVRLAVNLISCDLAMSYQSDGTELWQTALATADGVLSKGEAKHIAVDPSDNLPSVAITTGEAVHLPDWSTAELPTREEEDRRVSGFSSSLVLPLIKGKQPIGGLALIRKAQRAFTADEIALAESFADQAVIAIENVRLFHETETALVRQTASADILRVISGAQEDAQPVFMAIAEAGLGLLDCDIATVMMRDGDHFVPQAGRMREKGPLLSLDPTPVPIDPAMNYPSRVFSSGEMVHIPDFSTADLPKHEIDTVPKFGMKSAIFLPMLRDGYCVGVLVFTRNKVARAFSPEDIELAHSFCDQAVIAIENARLFNETQASLSRQTASANILRVISKSPTDVTPVFEEIVTSAIGLVSCDRAVMLRVDDTSLWQAAVADAGGLKKIFQPPGIRLMRWIICLHGFWRQSRPSISRIGRRRTCQRRTRRFKRSLATSHP